MGKLKKLKMATVIIDPEEDDIAEIVANDNRFKPIYVGTKDSRRMNLYKDGPAFKDTRFEFVKTKNDIIPTCEKIIADNGYKAVITKN